jgi:hypothetical protein
MRNKPLLREHEFKFCSFMKYLANYDARANVHEVL